MPLDPDLLIGTDLNRSFFEVVRDLNGTLTLHYVHLSRLTDCPEEYLDAEIVRNHKDWLPGVLQPGGNAWRGVAHAVNNFVMTHAKDVPPTLHRAFLEHMIRALLAFRDSHQAEIDAYMKKLPVGEPKAPR